MYTSDYEAKLLICDYAKRLYARGLVSGNDGNISCRVGRDEAWITPTMESKGFLSPEMLIKVDLDGNKRNETGYRASSETRMHLGILRENSKINCVIHAHPTYATAFAVIGMPVDGTLLPEASIFFGNEIGVAPFAEPGSDALRDSVLPFCRAQTRAALLANHGAITWGATMKDAYFAMETLESYCKVVLLVKQVAGQWNTLPDEALKSIAMAREQLFG